MKRKKVMTITALVFTCATIASCGKTTETVNAEPVIQATEQIVLETETEETPQVSADQGEGDSISLQPTMDESGRWIYPDYPEEYIKFNPIDPIKLWCVKQVDTYVNPNANKGELIRDLKSAVGIEIEVDATCEIDGVAYYRIVPINNDNRYTIIEQDALSETPPEEDITTGTNEINYNDDDAAFDAEMAAIAAEIYGEDNVGYGDVSDLPDAPDYGSLEDLPDETLDALSRLQWE